MAVKIAKEREVMGKRVIVTRYLPENVPLTRERRDKADLLDLEIKTVVTEINKEYESLKNAIKKDEVLKWRWLGTRLNSSIKKLKNLEQTDLDNHIIWPAFAQYMREELKRGYDAKRSGTRKDHYRKAWLLGTLPNLEWIMSWGGWDAIVDRGEQLSQNNKLMPLLNKKFKDKKLSTKQYQKLAKMLTEKLPSVRGQSVEIDSMDDKTLSRLVDDLYSSIGSDTGS
jgi:hypothetical protein